MKINWDNIAITALGVFDGAVYMFLFMIYGMILTVGIEI